MKPSKDPQWPFTTAFRERVAQVMEHFHVPGLSTAVVKGGDVFAEGFGKASIEHNRPATPETLYYAGSTTKSFTAASILKVIESSQGDGQPLSLSTKLASILREEFVLSDSYATEHITLEDVLCHRTGMPRHDYSIGGVEDSVLKMTRRLRHLLMTAELREKWQYCNLLYVVLGYAIENLAACSLSNYWRESFWNKLDMKSTFFNRADIESSSNREAGVELATGYWWSDQRKSYIETPYMMGDNSLLGGAGAIISNVLDYVKWLKAMLVQDSRILSTKSFADLRLPRVPVVYEGQPKAFIGPPMYGLGWHHAIYHGHQMFFHGGGTTGFGTQMAYLPTLEDGVGIIIMANAENGSNFAAQVLMYDILHSLLDLSAEQCFDWFSFYSKLSKEHLKRLDDPAELIEKAYPTVDPKKPKLPLPLPLPDYTGTFANPGYGSVIVEIVNEKLHIDASQRLWIHRLDFDHIGGNHFLAFVRPHKDASGGFLNSTIPIEYRIDAGGNVTSLGIAYEGALGKEKTWFDRQNDEEKS